VVLLHGITGSGLDWQPVAERLAQERRVIALDARGHGESEWSVEEAYAPDHHFADLAGALDALGVARCTLVGFSMGGAVATIYAAARPERVTTLVIVDAYPAPEMSPGSRRIAAFIATIYAEDQLMLPAGFDPAIARRMRDDLAADAARRLDLWPLWQAGGCPALLVRGESSDVLTAATAAEMVRRRPGTRLVTVPGVGHQVPQQRPQALAEAILDC
jgi:pimeloyl-ACP methyl ester carboxylesterase